VRTVLQSRSRRGARRLWSPFQIFPAIFPYGLAVALLATACAAPGAPPAANVTGATADWSTVAPIFERRCLGCHSGEIAGAPRIDDYSVVRRLAPLIRDRVATRAMPPWHVDPEVGIYRYANDISLPPAERNTVLAWIDAGLPFGAEQSSAAALHPRGIGPEDDLGPPDLVVLSDPYDIEPTGADQWWGPTVESGLLEDRWIRAIEVRPSPGSGRRVTHHAMVFLDEGDGERLLTEWGMGKGVERLPQDAGRPIRAGARVRWDIHYHPIGTSVPQDRVELALWFHPVGEEPRFANVLQFFRADADDGPVGVGIDLPPESRRTTRAVHLLDTPVRVESFQPHMHLRGTGMDLEVVLPGGEPITLTRVDRYDHRWQMSYRYAEEVVPLLPSGTKLILTAHFDNTAGNPNNPDPEQWVGFGRRTVDEMAHAWIGITELSEEEFRELRSLRDKGGSVRPLLP
jgi:hypothetical protein